MAKDWIWAIVCPIIAYFIGSINFAYIFTKIKIKKNLWEVGTKNVGGFNAMLQTSGVYGAIAGTFDLLKGLGAVLTVVYLPIFDDVPLYAADPKWELTWHSITCILVAATVTLGHCYSIFLKFRGGRGLGASMGILWFLNPLLLAVIFLINLIFIFSTKYVRPAQFVGFIIGLPIAFFIPIFPPWIPLELRTQLMLGLLATGLIAVMFPKYLIPFIDMFRGKEYQIKEDHIDFKE
ncbi:MAG: hypothetical protein GF308_19740 [Candidatus Heimdallarchaeota archaeon]|nr:hypothetical protein [Candidatus Heimdallarchaeota archaeon]